MKEIVYTFVSPFCTEQTVALICDAIKGCRGVVKESQPRHGRVKATVRNYGFRKDKYNFYVEHSTKGCRVRMVMGNDGGLNTKSNWRARDYVWDMFLKQVFTLAPNIDFGVSLAEGDPYIMGVLYLDDDIEQVCVSRGKSNAFMIGGLLGNLFVGGMSGKQRTVSHSFNQFASSRLTRIIYNNGRLWEGNVTKGSELYNEIMVNMQ